MRELSLSIVASLFLVSNFDSAKHQVCSGHLKGATASSEDKLCIAAKYLQNAYILQ